jgi:hypothetical protein
MADPQARALAAFLLSVLVTFTRAAEARAMAAQKRLPGRHSPAI